MHDLQDVAWNSGVQISVMTDREEMKGNVARIIQTFRC
jgi:hypothetical protein